VAELSNIVMPRLGLTMKEGTLSEWQVAAGDKVRAGQILFVVETDKLATEVEATGDGEIVELLAEAGSTLPVGTAVARWTGRSGGAAEGAAGAGGPEDAVEPSIVTVAARSSPNGASRIVATPLARRLAAMHGVDLAALVGSGARGRIQARDIPKAPAPPMAPAAASAQSAEGERVATTMSQAAVARRLSESKREIPHFYLAAEADVGALADLRASLNGDCVHPKLSVNHFILAAVARAWRDDAAANRVWRDPGLMALQSIDVGMAVETPRGLFAPVIRGAASLDIDALAATADIIAARAREGRLTPDDMSGGAVTVSNMGMYDVTYLTPIINPGQSAILGVGTVREVFRPDERGQPDLRRELGLVLACDHRVFNGVQAAKLLGAIIDHLEHPARFLRRGTGGGRNGAV